MKKIQNKWIRAAIPALLLHCSIGTVYCWSIFSQEIADYIGFSKGATEWAFSFAIFFLGMSAAFLGNVVEKDIHRSSLIAAVCFAAGMAGTGFFIWYGGAHPHSPLALIGIYVCYGFIMGIGLGTGYLSPLKTLMLWFQDRKGLATGLAVAGFGAAKAIASPIMQALLNSLGEGGIYKMFLILACVYFVMMFVGHLLLAKPEGWHEPASQEKGARAIDVIKTKPVVFIGIWLMFYINITCGLALISQEKMIIKCIGLAGMAGVLSSVTAIFNAGGRLGFSAWADTMKDRNTVYKIMIILSIIATGLVILTQGIADMGQSTFLMILVLILLFVVNAGYGGGFSNVPTLLSDHYGMQNISAIHGITLSAWAIAGLTGNQLATFIVNHVGEMVDVSDGHGGLTQVNPVGYQTVLYVTIVLYVIALLCSFFLVGSKKKKAEA
ncbi:MAG: OFA family MFS transporter [Lachnospiraceae bacterium]|nr:OFA family MFS transporter [Lachnospiraceae bacterium]